MNRTPVRVGVVGAGWWAGHAHLPALVDDPDAVVVGVADAEIGRARAAAELFGVPHAVDGAEALLELDLDAAVVATPQGDHHAVAALLLDAGIDVLVEKPLTVAPAEAWDLVRRARASGARLHVGHTFPHDPVVARLREAVAAGTLGELVVAGALFATAVAPLYRGETGFAQRDTGAPFAARPTTYANPASGGQLYSQATHAASVLLWVTDGEARRVTAFEDRRGHAVDVADALCVELSDGALATLTSTGTVHDNALRVEEYRFFGRDGHALLDTVRQDLTIHVSGRTEPIAVTAPDDRPLERRPAAALVASALNRAPVVVPGELGARVVDLLAAARASARAGGRPVEVVPHPE